MNSIAQLSQTCLEINSIAHHYYDSVTSTQTIAKKEFNGQKSPLIILSEQQTAGRGRHTNVWDQSSNLGGQFFSTWCFRLTQAPYPVLAALVGLSLYQALLKVWPGLSLSLKAPNDIYLNDKKIGGILIEIVAQIPNHDLFIGIGLNVFDRPQSVPTSGCIMDVLPSDQIQKKWCQFLSHLHLSLNELTKQLSQELSTHQCEQLKRALNLWPGLKEIYTDVFTDGGLQQGSLITHWSEL